MILEDGPGEGIVVFLHGLPLGQRKDGELDFPVKSLLQFENLILVYGSFIADDEEVEVAVFIVGSCGVAAVQDEGDTDFRDGFDMVFGQEGGDVCPFHFSDSVVVVVGGEEVEVAGDLSFNNAVFLEEIAVELDTAGTDSEFLGKFLEISLLCRIVEEVFEDFASDEFTKISEHAIY